MYEVLSVFSAVPSDLSLPHAPNSAPPHHARHPRSLNDNPKLTDLQGQLSNTDHLSRGEFAIHDSLVTHTAICLLDAWARGHPSSHIRSGVAYV